MDDYENLRRKRLILRLIENVIDDRVKKYSPSFGQNQHSQRPYFQYFRGKSTQTAVKTALSRLGREGKLKRLAHGIYYLPKIAPLFGAVFPASEEVAEKIAIKEKILIKPAGAYA